MVDDRPPHVFSLAAMAYSNLIDNGEAQSIMISGESGAGKTEATKLCLSSLALVSQSSGELTEKVCSRAHASSDCLNAASGVSVPLLA